MGGSGGGDPVPGLPLCGVVDQAQQLDQSTFGGEGVVEFVGASLAIHRLRFFSLALYPCWRLVVPVSMNPGSERPQNRPGKPEFRSCLGAEGRGKGV